MLHRVFILKAHCIHQQSKLADVRRIALATISTQKIMCISNIGLIKAAAIDEEEKLVDEKKVDEGTQLTS